MKLIINQSREIAETEIVISCSHVTPELEKIISRIRMLDCSINGKKDDCWHRIPVERILYFDSVDGRTFLYCAENCFEAKETLGELEERLKNLSFVRISKSALVNLRHLKAAKALDFSRMEILLSNGEKLIVTRHYLFDFKKAFGL